MSVMQMVSCSFVKEFVSIHDAGVKMYTLETVCCFCSLERLEYMVKHHVKDLITNSLEITWLVNRWLGLLFPERGGGVAHSAQCIA